MGVRKLRGLAAGFDCKCRCAVLLQNAAGRRESLRRRGGNRIPICRPQDAYARNFRPERRNVSVVSAENMGDEGDVGGLVGYAIGARKCRAYRATRQAV